MEPTGDVCHVFFHFAEPTIASITMRNEINSGVGETDRWEVKSDAGCRSRSRTKMV